MSQGTVPASSSQRIEPEPVRSQHVRVAIVGAGFGGLGMAIRLKQRGYGSFVVLERGVEVGGTWRDNAYPGCACDVQSLLYSFSFAPYAGWTRTYAPQTEIQAYLRDCVHRFDIGPHIRLSHEVLGATWDDGKHCWRVETRQGALTADVLVLGNGPLSEPSFPAIPGLLDRFQGTLFHSARWQHDHDLTGERVAIIGTGASAIQLAPEIRPICGRLHVFQRTPPWILPRQDRPITDRQRALYQALPLTQRLARAAIYWQREQLVLAFVYRTDAMKSAERLALRHLQRQVPDPELRAKLTPQYMLGCKRILLSDDFYPALCENNVELVTERIREMSAHGIVTDDGHERDVDTIIVATGFHATDMPLARQIVGHGGQTLRETWSASGPQAYLGTTVSGFPNLFVLIGPNTGLGHSSMVFMIESQLAYILDCLRVMDRRNARVVEVRSAVQSGFNVEMQRRSAKTVWTSGCSSWYLGALGRNTTMWPGFTWEYRWRTRRFRSADYQLTPATAHVPLQRSDVTP